MVAPVMEPLLKIAVFANLVGVKAGECLVYLLGEQFVSTKFTRRLGSVNEALARHGKVGGTAV